MKKIDELRLIAQCALGDNRQAFGQLVEAYQSQLRRFLMNLTGGDEMLTDDLAQETFLKAYVNVRNFKGLSSFATWLYRIAYNEFYSHVRSQHPTQNIDEAPAGDSLSDRSAIATETSLTVREAMAQLSESERAIITLFYIDDLPIKKVAQIVSLPESTVKSHLRRGKEKMKNLIKSPY